MRDRGVRQIVLTRKKGLRARSRFTRLGRPRQVEAKYTDFEYNGERLGGLSEFLGSEWFSGWRDADGNDVWDCVRGVVGRHLAEGMSEDELCDYVEANGLLKDLESKVNGAMF